MRINEIYTSINLLNRFLLEYRESPTLDIQSYGAWILPSGRILTVDDFGHDTAITDYMTDNQIEPFETLDNNRKFAYDNGWVRVVLVPNNSQNELNLEGITSHFPKAWRHIRPVYKNYDNVCVDCVDGTYYEFSLEFPHHHREFIKLMTNK